MDGKGTGPARVPMGPRTEQWINRPVALSGSAMVHKPLGLLAELTHRCPLGCPYCSILHLWKFEPSGESDEPAKVSD